MKKSTLKERERSKQKERENWIRGGGRLLGERKKSKFKKTNWGPLYKADQ